MDAITTKILQQSGWQPGVRNTNEVLAKWWGKLSGFVRQKAAEDALQLFGGLNVDAAGAGESMARQSFHLDPTLAEGEEEFFEHEGKRLGKVLFPLGEGEHGHYFLAIDEDGTVYALGHWYIDWVGESIERAIENLVHGRRGNRIFKD